jgi:hypothetical protein
MHKDDSGRVKSYGKMPNAAPKGTNMRSSREYMSKKPGNKFKTPAADADNGGSTSGYAGTRGGNKRYMSTKKGNTFAKPPASRRHVGGVDGSSGSGWLVGGIKGGKSGRNTPGGYAGDK